MVFGQLTPNKTNRTCFRCMTACTNMIIKPSHCRRNSSAMTCGSMRQKCTCRISSSWARSSSTFPGLFLHCALEGKHICGQLSSGPAQQLSPSIINYPRSWNFRPAVANHCSQVGSAAQVGGFLQTQAWPQCDVYSDLANIPFTVLCIECPLRVETCRSLSRASSSHL